MSIKGDTLRLQGQLETKFDKREKRPQRFRAIMGDGTGAVKVPGKRNYVYVRRLGRGLIEECLNNKAPARDGLPIIAGCSHESPDLLQVLEVDWTSFAEPGSYAYAPPHHESHEFRNVYGGDDVVWVQKQQVLPLLAHPTSPVSMSVVVLDDWYPWDTGWHYFEEVTSADLTAHIPALAGQARYVLISIDGATEALQYTIGGLFPILLPPADAENMIPAPPLGSIPIVGVYLTGVTTAIDWENLYDLRLFNQPIGGSVSPGPHALLDTVVHSDTVTNAPTRGSLVLANATPAWDELVHPGGAGYALTTDANDVIWDQTPTWTGNHTFNAGLTIPAAQAITMGDLAWIGLGPAAGRLVFDDAVPDEARFEDCGYVGIENILYHIGDPDTYLVFSPDFAGFRVGNVNMIYMDENGVDIITLNPSEVDVDFRVCANGITDALFVQGSTGFVGAGRATPEGHLDVYDITVNTTISYYGIHNEHIKTLGATDYLDVLEGIHNHIEFDQNGAAIGPFTGINSRTILTSGSVGDGGARDMMGIYNYLWMEDATCTVTDDVQGLFTEVDLGGGTIGDDVMGYHIYVHLRAGLTSVGGDVFGTRIYLHAETDPAGTVYAIYWWEGDNIDYGIYQNGTAPNLFGGNLVLDDGVGDSPQVQFIGGSNNDTYTIFCEDDAVAGNSDLVVTMPAADTDARFIWRNSTPADVAYVDAAGNADFEGHMAVGANAAITASDIVYAEEIFTDLAGVIYGSRTLLRFAPTANFATTMYANRFLVKLETAWARTAGTLTGIAGIVYVDNAIAATNLNMVGGLFYTDVEDAAAVVAIGAQVETPAVDTGSCTTGYGLRIAQGVVGAGSITTLYGLYINTIDEGGTNYAIYTGAGTVRLGDYTSIVVPGVAATAESVLRLEVSDAAGDYFQIQNATNVDGIFSPLIIGEITTATNRIPLVFSARTHVGGDVGTTPMLLFDVRRNTPAAMTTRTPLFQWKNFTTNLMVLDVYGRLALGPTVPLGQMHVDQAAAGGAVPVLYLDQADVSEEMIEFATTIGVGNAIEAVGGKTLTTTHFIKVTLPGPLTRYIPVGTIA